MTPEALADVHHRAFSPARGWTAEEFSTLLQQKTVDLFSRGGGFALVRTVAGEAELLTLAVDPQARRCGIATALLQDWLNTSDATHAFIEVASDNIPALSLYAKHGFVQTGMRKGYYSRPDGGAVDAVLMQIALTDDGNVNSPPARPKTG